LSRLVPIPDRRRSRRFPVVEIQRPTQPLATNDSTRLVVHLRHVIKDSWSTTIGSAFIRGLVAADRETGHVHGPVWSSPLSIAPRRNAQLLLARGRMTSAMIFGTGGPRCHSQRDPVRGIARGRVIKVRPNLNRRCYHDRLPSQPIPNNGDKHEAVRCSLGANE